MPAKRGRWRNQTGRDWNPFICAVKEGFWAASAPTSSRMLRFTPDRVCRVSSRLFGGAVSHCSATLRVCQIMYWQSSFARGMWRPRWSSTLPKLAQITGRPPITWLHQICSDCGLSAGDALNCAQDRAVCRTYAAASSASRWRRRRWHYNLLLPSDVDKDLTCKAKAKAKDLSFKAKAKDLTFKAKAKAKAKDLSLKANAKVKDTKIVLKDSLRTRPRPRPNITAAAITILLLMLLLLLLTRSDTTPTESTSGSADRTQNLTATKLRKDESTVL